MKPKNILYAQSGGVTAVINATACGVIETAKQFPNHFGKVFAGHNGIVGALNEDLIDTSLESDAAIAALRHTPAGAFGSCRYKLSHFEKDRSQYERLIEVFAAHHIGYFFYNGGGDSQDTAHKISQIGEIMGYPIQCIGIPKTIDNDLPHTDTCPGFGSVAKYVATSIREATYDLASMYATSTQVFIMEVMGRHAGWIAGAAGLAAEQYGDGPHIILFPEIPLDETTFLQRVHHCVSSFGYCSIVVSEGLKNKEGKFLHEVGSVDDFGHKQLGGVAPVIAQMIKQEHGYKFHWAVLDYLQRAARHLASKVDVEQAYALGKAAVELAVQGHNAVMPTIVRTGEAPYTWTISHVSLAEVANKERTMPREYITEEGFGITDIGRRYFAPLIQGEDYPPYLNGLPHYVKLKNIKVDKKL